jgi:cytochrome b involved in lipid metabolism
MSETYTAAQVAEHKTEEKGLWIIVDGSVYDVSTFIKEHPGGPKILKRSAGKDASKSFWKVRSVSATHGSPAMGYEEKIY